MQFYYQTSSKTKLSLALFLILRAASALTLLSLVKRPLGALQRFEWNCLLQPNSFFNLSQFYGFNVWGLRKLSARAQRETLEAGTISQEFS